MLWSQVIDQLKVRTRGLDFSWGVGCLRALVAVMAFAGSGLGNAYGQGRLDAVLSTGNPAGFSRWSGVLPLPSRAGSDLRIEFDCGLATEGTPAPDGPEDSLTGWIVDATGRQAAVLFQVDAVSFVLAPRSAGFVPLDSALFRVSATTLAPPALGFTPLAAESRHVSFQLPNTFQTLGASFQLSLLEDMDEVRSVGWVSNLRVVPEPGGLFPLACGLLVLACVGDRVRARRMVSKS